MERRRGARIPARMWVQIAGVDEEPRLARGDISMSGLFIEVDRSIGEPGSVQTVSVTSFERESSVDILARIVRVVSVHDVWHGPGVAGIAFEFLPDDPGKRVLLERVIRDVMASKSYVAESLSGSVTAQLDPSVEEEAPRATAAEKLGVRVMVLDTSWAVSVGETIHCQIETPTSGRRARLDGRVVRSTLEPSGTGGARYRLEVEFARALGDEAGTVAEGRSISDAMDSLLEDVVFPGTDGAPPRTREHLAGLLARIRLPSLLSFLALERLSGVLTLERSGARGVLHLRDGQVVDAEVDGRTDNPRALVTELCGWSDGQFDFSLRQVNRLDRINQPTTALLAGVTPARDRD
jgi:hypothetical protein